LDLCRILDNKVLEDRTDFGYYGLLPEIGYDTIRLMIDGWFGGNEDERRDILINFIKHFISDGIHDNVE